MEETVSVEKTAIIVNVSVLHNSNDQLTVLKNLARLHPSYFLNMPYLFVEFKKGNFNNKIDQYKTGKITTAEFREFIRTTLNLPVTVSDKEIDDAWNSLIINEGRKSSCCSCFSLFQNPSLSTQQRFHRLLTYTVDGKPPDRIYLVSNTNPLNIGKTLEYLSKKFPELIVGEDGLKMLLNPLQNEEDRNTDKDVKISREGQLPEVFVSVSYIYGAFKTETQNIATTPALLKTLIEKLRPENIKGVISQYSQDRIQAQQDRVNPKYIINPDDVFSSKLTQQNSLPQDREENSRGYLSLLST